MSFAPYFTVVKCTVDSFDRCRDGTWDIELMDVGGRSSFFQGCKKMALLFTTIVLCQNRSVCLSNCIDHFKYPFVDDFASTTAEIIYTAGQCEC